MSQNTAIMNSIPPRHYPTRAAKCADLIVHVSGLVLALVGAVFLLIYAARSGDLSRVAAIGIYSAGIFLMIAASYTPFTTQRLEGAWAWGMTAAVWGLAAFGIFGKFCLPSLSKRFWVGFYIALGWIVVIAIQPLSAALHWVPLMLLAIGGVIYTAGVVFHVNKSLTYSHAIWHGHVVAAAGTHWAAILVGVVLVPV